MGIQRTAAALAALLLLAGCGAGGSGTPVPDPGVVADAPGESGLDRLPTRGPCDALPAGSRVEVFLPGDCADCVVRDEAAGTDQNFTTATVLEVPGQQPRQGQVLLRATAADGRHYAAGQTPGVFFRLRGYTVFSLLLRTYRNGTLQEEFSLYGGAVRSPGGGSDGVGLMPTRRDYDAIEVAFTPTAGSDGRLELFEFCGAADAGDAS